MVAGRTPEPRIVTVTIPSAAVITKALAGNVATLTTSAAHGFAAGQQVRVAGVDATFNGTYTIAAVPTTTTFTYGRTAADVASTAATGTVLSTRVTAPAGSFNEEDAGRAIVGAGIPAGSTVIAVTSDAAAVLSAAATAAGTVPASLGATQGYGFVGWSPETDAESETYTVAAAGAGTATPDRITNTTTGVTALRRARG